jgi:hypothetical protein
MSLTEILIIVVVIGIIAAIALPSISNIRGVAKKTTAIQNAKSISQMSSALAALGVAHVIPDSMGGVEATARLLREGVIVPEGPMAGEKFVLMGLNDDEIETVASYLYVQYDRKELRLIFRDPELNQGTGLNGSFEGPLLVERMPCRHCATRG